jgi:hypothetical protein
MLIVARPFETLSRASWTACSDVESRAEVASSRSLESDRDINKARR